MACVAYKCVNPCVGVCGELAICHVSRHNPTCTCPPGFTGDPFFQCREALRTTEQFNPCSPSPCGPSSNCRNNAGQAVCSCAPGFIGSPPQCRPECVVSSECAPDRACVNNKCADPCPNTCGFAAVCNVNNHNPICSCPPGTTGDPFKHCSPIRKPNPHSNVFVFMRIEIDI